MVFVSSMFGGAVIFFLICLWCPSGSPYLVTICGLGIESLVFVEDRWGLICVPGPQVTTGNFSHLVGNDHVWWASPMVISCK